MTSDEALYAAWAAGDTTAGGELIDRHLAAMARFFANKLTDRTDLDDLVSRTFELCAKGLGGFRADSRFRTYLFGIATNVLREHLRRRTTGGADLESSAIADLGPSPSSVVRCAHEGRLLLAALRAIPFELQVLLELTYFEDMSRSECADALGVPEGTIATRLRRARELLRAQVEALASSPAVVEGALGNLEEWAQRVRGELPALAAEAAIDSGNQKPADAHSSEVPRAGARHS